MSAIRNARDYYPPTQNGKEKRPGLITQADFLRLPFYGASGEILLHTSGAGGVGRYTRLAGPAEDVHLRSGDGAGSYAFAEASQGVYLGNNAYWDGVDWMRYDTGAGGHILGLDSFGLDFRRFEAGANPIVVASNATFSIGDLLALDSRVAWPKSLLNFADAIDEWNAFAMTAGTWYSMKAAAHNFTVNSTASHLLVAVRLSAPLLMGGAAAYTATRVLIDGATAYPLAGDTLSIGQWGALHGGVVSIPGGLAAGAHTLAVQGRSDQAATLYLRCATAPANEFSTVQIEELNP